MQYDLQIENVTSVRRRLVFTLPPDTIQTELDSAFRDLRHRVRLPGFRKGKVPRNVLESRFGKQVRGDISGKLIDQAYRQAVADLPVAGQPVLEDRGDIAGGEPFKFTIGVDVRPEVEVSGYQSLELRYEQAQLSDAEVDAAVASRVAGLTRIAEVTEDRGVQVGDLVLTELKLSAGDEVVADQAGTMVHTQGEQFYPGVETLLEGLKKDEQKTGTVTIRESSQLEELAGREFEATVKVLAIQAHVTPEASDESAKELGYDDLAAMREALQVELQKQYDEAGRNDARVRALRALVDLNDIEVPSGMVEEHLSALVEEMKVRRTYQGEDARSIRFSDEEVADMRSRARFAAKASLILEGVARHEGIEVFDEDIDAKIEEIASLRGQTGAAIRGYLQKEDALGVLHDRILEEKTLEWLLDHATLTMVAPGTIADSQGAADDEPVIDEPVVEEPAEEAVAEEAVAEEAVAEEAVASPTWNAKMKKAELLAIAKDLGLSVNTKNTKAQIIEALDQTL